uniref:Uncharacterized protein n=1 Tax=Cucumis melo TaxID=3656 RepID=A0A9I9EGX5_CUCME
MMQPFNHRTERYYFLNDVNITNIFILAEVEACGYETNELDRNAEVDPCFFQSLYAKANRALECPYIDDLHKGMLVLVFYLIQVAYLDDKIKVIVCRKVHKLAKHLGIRTKTSEILKIIMAPLCLQTISIATFAKKVIPFGPMSRSF